MSALNKGRYFWRSALSGVRHSPFVHLVAVTTISIALFSAGIARGGLQLVENLKAQLGGEVEITIYLAHGAEDERIEELLHGLRERTGGEVRLVPPGLALERLATELGDLGSALADLPENPLPASLELRVPPALRDPLYLRALARELEALPEVSGVDYGEVAVARLSAISRALTAAAMVAFLLVIVATVIVTSATLQLAIYARREEIEIQKLVGATDRFVTAPFLIEGLIQGLIGSAVAALGLWLFAREVAPRLEQLFSFIVTSGPTPDLVSARGLLELAAVGCALGLCGSFIAVGRFLRV
jgi:cell division transport system permease protein